MTYQPVSITADLTNTVQAGIGFVRLANPFVTIPFPYLAQGDIKAEPADTQFKFANPGVVEVTQSWDINTLPQTVTFTRETPVDEPAVVFVPGSNIRAQDLNTALLQLRYRLEELDEIQP